MLKKLPSDEIKVTKNAPSFLSRILSHHSVTFILIRAEAQGSSLRNRE